MNMLESRWNMMERDGAEKEPRLSNVSCICNNFRAILLYLYIFFLAKVSYATLYFKVLHLCNMFTLVRFIFCFSIFRLE